MFRLDINQNCSTLYLRDQERDQDAPVLVITKDGRMRDTQISRTKVCEQGLIPTSAVYKQTKKIMLENEHFGNITVERLDVNQNCNTWPVKWTFKLSQGDIVCTFCAPTPDAVLAYEYYFHDTQRNIFQTPKLEAVLF